MREWANWVKWANWFKWAVGGARKRQVGEAVQGQMGQVGGSSKPSGRFMAV